MAKSVTTQNSSNWSKSTQSNIQKNGFLRTAGQRAMYNKMNAKTKKSEKKVNNLLSRGWKNPYESQLRDTVNKINNNKFEYDLNQDELYNQYKEQYIALGNQAMQEAQAEATALTGGFANSNAATVGQQAYNNVIQQLQQLVPQLYSQARQDYDTNQSNLYNQANLLSGLSEQSYNQWLNKVTNAISNRDYNYNKSNNYYNSTQYSSNKSTQTSTGGSSSSSTTKKKK